MSVKRDSTTLIFWCSNLLHTFSLHCSALEYTQSKEKKKDLLPAKCYAQNHLISIWVKCKFTEGLSHVRCYSRLWNPVLIEKKIHKVSRSSGKAFEIFKQGSNMN